MKPPVLVISDVEKAKVLTDPVRRLMLDLLAVNPMTEAQLAQRLDLSEASVNHHLKLLKSAGLIKIVKTEAESHGILQKFYQPTSTVVMIDYPKMPYKIRRYAFALYLERLRGTLAAFTIVSKEKPTISWNNLERLTDMFAEEVVNIGRGFKQMPHKMGREEFILQMYALALRKLSSRRTPEVELLKRLLPKPARLKKHR